MYDLLVLLNDELIPVAFVAVDQDTHNLDVEVVAEVDQEHWSSLIHMAGEKAFVVVPHFENGEEILYTQEVGKGDERYLHGMSEALRDVGAVSVVTSSHLKNLFLKMSDVPVDQRTEVMGELANISPEQALALAPLIAEMQQLVDLEQHDEDNLVQG